MSADAEESFFEMLELATHAAAAHEQTKLITVHPSQSYRSAVVAAYVTCPDDMAKEIAVAFNESVAYVLSAPQPAARRRQVQLNANEVMIQTRFSSNAKDVLNRFLMRSSTDFANPPRNVENARGLGRPRSVAEITKRTKVIRVSLGSICWINVSSDLIAISF